MCDKVKRVRLSPPDNRLPNQPTDVQGVWGGGGGGKGGGGAPPPPPPPPGPGGATPLRFF